MRIKIIIKLFETEVFLDDLIATIFPHEESFFVELESVMASSVRIICLAS